MMHGNIKDIQKNLNMTEIAETIVIIEKTTTRDIRKIEVDTIVTMAAMTIEKKITMININQDTKVAKEVNLETAKETIQKKTIKIKDITNEMTIMKITTGVKKLTKIKNHQ